MNIKPIMPNHDTPAQREADLDQCLRCMGRAELVSVLRQTIDLNRDLFAALVKLEERLDLGDWYDPETVGEELAEYLDRELHDLTGRLLDGPCSMLPTDDASLPEPSFAAKMEEWYSGQAPYEPRAV